MLVEPASGGGDIEDVIHVSSEDEDADDEDGFFIGPDNSMFEAVGKAAARKRGASQSAAQNSRVKQQIAAM